MALLPGKIAAVKVAGTAYTFDKIEFSQDSAIADVSNFSSQFALFVEGGYKGTIKVSGPYDTANMVAFVPGADLTLDVIYNTVGPIHVAVPCIVKSVSNSVDWKDAQRISIELQSTGTFQLGPI